MLVGEGRGANNPSTPPLLQPRTGDQVGVGRRCCCLLLLRQNKPASLHLITALGAIPFSQNRTPEARSSSGIPSSHHSLDDDTLDDGLLLHSPDSEELRPRAVGHKGPLWASYVDGLVPNWPSLFEKRLRPTIAVDRARSDVRIHCGEKRQAHRWLRLTVDAVVGMHQEDPVDTPTREQQHYSRMAPFRPAGDNNRRDSSQVNGFLPSHPVKSPSSPTLVITTTTPRLIAGTNLTRPAQSDGTTHTSQGMRPTAQQQQQKPERACGVPAGADQWHGAAAAGRPSLVPAAWSSAARPSVRPSDDRGCRFCGTDGLGTRINNRVVPFRPQKGKVSDLSCRHRRTHATTGVPAAAAPPPPPPPS